MRYRPSRNDPTVRPSGRTIPLSALAVLTVILVCPWAEVRAQRQGTEPAQPAARVPVFIDEDGRPVYGDPLQEPSKPEARKAGTQAPATPEQPSEPDSRQDPEPVTPARDPVQPRPEGRSSLDDPLLAVLSVVGTRAEFATIPGLRATVETTVFAPDGESLGTDQWIWSARPVDGDRDRFELPGHRSLRREGRRVTVIEPGVGESTPTAAERSRLALIGSVLRSPWSLADARSFELVREEPGRSDGESELTFRERAPGLLERSSTRRADEIVLVRDAESARPLGLRLHLLRSGDGRERNLRFAGWRRVGAVEMPTIHEFLRLDGSVALRIRLRNLSVGPIGDEARNDAPEGGSVPVWVSPEKAPSSSTGARDDG